MPYLIIEAEFLRHGQLVLSDTPFGFPVLVSGSARTHTCFFFTAGNRCAILTYYTVGNHGLGGKTVTLAPKPCDQSRSVICERKQGDWFVT